MLGSLAVGRFARPEADSRRFSGGWMRQGQILGDLTFSTFLTHSDLREVRVYIVEEVNRAKENAEEKTKRCLLLE